MIKKTVKINADSWACPVCGEKGFAIYRHPGSPLHCEDGHKWQIYSLRERVIGADGRARFVEIEELYEVIGE